MSHVGITRTLEHLTIQYFFSIHVMKTHMIRTFPKVMPPKLIIICIFDFIVTVFVALASSSVLGPLNAICVENNGDIQRVGREKKKPNAPILFMWKPREKYEITIEIMMTLARPTGN